VIVKQPDPPRSSPVQVTRLRIDDIDEAVSVLNGSYGDHTRTPLAR
jgi:hypothetical protein